MSGSSRVFRNEIEYDFAENTQDDDSAQRHSRERGNPAALLNVNNIGHHSFISPLVGEIERSEREG